nr:hypothetical protein [Tanacetum cinerariifolium]
MSANDKFWLGYGDYRYGSILSYDNEVLQSVFMNKVCDLENIPVNDRYTKGMHTVPPPMTRNYMTYGPDVEIDYSKFTYGPKQTLADKSDSKLVEYASSDSDSSVEPSTSLPESVVNESKVISEPKVVYEPKVWTDASIIEEYELDIDDDLVSNVQENIEKPSFAFTNSIKHVKTPRENVKETGTPNHYPKIETFSHLIRDCDFHEKRMAKQAALIQSKERDDPHKALKDKGIIDSGCSRHMTGNKAHLTDYQEFKGGSIAFGGSNGRITGKGKIKAGRLDFEDVYYVEELKHYNLLSVSQMYDKKNKSDNGTEFKNHDLIELCGSKGIKREYSNARTPQQNEVTKRKNRTLVEAGRTMVLVTKPQNKTPYDLLNVRQPIISYLRPFGCHVTILNTIDQLGKFDGKSNSGFLVGYSLNNKAFKRSRDKIRKNEKPVSLVEQIFQEELEKLKRQEKEANVVARKEATHETQDVNTNSTNLLNAVSIPVSVVGPLRALNDAEPSYPDDPSMPHLEDIYASPNTWIFTNSSYDDEAVETRSKVHKNSKAHALVSYIQKQQRNNYKDFQHCLFSCFLSQVEPKKISQALEDKSWVDAMQEELLQFQIQKEERIDYDEVFAPVARIEAIRIFLAFASYMGFIVYQMDVKSAFLYDSIDEEVKQKEDGIFISQDKYVAEILKKFNFLKVKTASTPIETQKPLVKDEEAADVDVHLYTSDYVGANLDRKSTTGGFQFLDRRLISWQCKKQTIVATSATEATYVAAAHSALLKGRLLEVTTAKQSKELASQKQTTLGKDKLNSLIVVSLLKTIWSSMHHVIEIKHWLFQSKRLLTVNDEVRVQALIDEKKVTIKESSIRRTLSTLVLRPPFGMNLAALWHQQSSTLQQTRSLTSLEHQLPSPSNDPILNAKDSLTLRELMDLCTRLNNKVLDLKSKVIDIKYSFTDRIQKLKDKVDQLEEKNMALKEKSFKTTQVDTAAPVVTTTQPTTAVAQVTKPSAPRRRRGVVIQDLKKTARSVIMHSELESKLNAYINWNDVIEQVKRSEKQDNTVMRYQALKRKPMTKAQARKNMMIYLKNIAGFKMDFFKGMTYSEIRPIFEKHYNSIQDFLEKEEEDVIVYEEGSCLRSPMLKLMDGKIKRMFLLVEKKYPLTHFTLQQMLDNVRLKVEEEKCPYSWIQKLKDRVDQLEEKNRALKEKSFKTTQVDTAAPVKNIEKSFKHGRMIANMDKDVKVNVEEAQAKAYNLDLQHAEKALSMQDIDEKEPAEVKEVFEVVKASKLMTEVVTTAQPTINAAQVTKPSAPKRRRGVLETHKVSVTSNISACSSHCTFKLNPNSLYNTLKVRLKVPVRRIRTNNGNELVNHTLRDYYDEVGISHETPVASSPQQNKVVERRNRTLIEAAHTMLIYAQAPLFLWAEAVATACFTQNRSIIRLRHGKTPHELLHSKLPDLSFFYVFGALCYLTNDSDNLGKLQPKADIGIFIGYAPTKKAFRIYNRRTRRIVETIHVDFDELMAMASEQRSSGPTLNEMTPGTISSGLVPTTSPSTSYLPPSQNDWDLLFQPMFDELLNPSPSVVNQTPEAIAPIAKVIPPGYVDSTGSPSSTTVDQDAPSTSNSPTPTETQSLVIPQNVGDDNLDIEVAHMGNDPLFGVPIPDVNST